MDATKLVDNMSIEEVVAWAGLLQVEHEYPPANGDDYPDSENTLRVALTDALNAKLFEFTTTDEELPSGVQLRLGALVRETMSAAMWDARITDEVMKVVYNSFFDEHGIPDEKYRQQVEICGNTHFHKYRQEIIQLLRKGG